MDVIRKRKGTYEFLCDHVSHNFEKMQKHTIDLPLEFLKWRLLLEILNTRDNINISIILTIITHNFFLILEKWADAIFTFL